MSHFPYNNTPRGHNDNNFNRKNFPSNQLPGQTSSGNPFDKFSGMSTNYMNQKSNGGNKFGDAYRPNQSVINPMNYTNRDELLHNNVGPMVLNEHITEYKLKIDSLDRDVDAFPNPFDFRVRFDDRADTGGPHILKRFRNIKYVKLVSVVLPQFGGLKEVGDEIFEFDEDNKLLDDRFILLEIPELEDLRIFSTSEAGTRIDADTGEVIKAPKPYANIYPDSVLGKYYYTGEILDGFTTYKDSRLGNLNSLTIKFYNSCGQPLDMANMFTGLELKNKAKNGEPVPFNDPRHPLNKNLQVYLSLVVGVGESQINTVTQFEQ